MPTLASKAAAAMYGREQRSPMMRAIIASSGSKRSISSCAREEAEGAAVFGGEGALGKSAAVARGYGAAAAGAAEGARRARGAWLPRVHTRVRVRAHPQALEADFIRQ